MTPSTDTWRSLSHFSALRLSRVNGVMVSPASSPMPSKSVSSAARRSSNGSSKRDWRAFRRRQSKTMKVAGVSLDRRTIRLSAGCRRICSASKESAPSTGMTSSPSSTNVFGETARKFSSTSGKKRDSDLPDLALISTSPPARKARQRNPSHLGSNCQPGFCGQFGDQLGFHRSKIERNSEFGQSCRAASCQQRSSIDCNKLADTQEVSSSPSRCTSLSRSKLGLGHPPCNGVARLRVPPHGKILLIWVYYSAQIVLFGAELTHAYATETGVTPDDGRECRTAA